MRTMWSAATRMVGTSLVGAILCGCSSAMMGIRPSEPPVRVTVVTAETRATAETTVCDEYIAYVEYARELQEAYHSRATLNRWWIYGAGIIGLGAVAATGGLAAASAATVGTMALLGISGGFTAGVFATLDNSTLADIYTIAAIRVDTALKDADGKLILVGPRGNRYTDKTKCNEALVSLKAAVSDARSRLERARTDSAMAAVERALHQQKVLRDLTKQIAADAQEGDPSVIPAENAQIRSAKLTTSSKITLTVFARLELVRGEMKVDVGGSKALRPWVEMRRLTSPPNMWELVVEEKPACSADPLPAPLPAPCKDYKFALVLDGGKKRIEGAADLKLTRPEPEL